MILQQIVGVILILSGILTIIFKQFNNNAAIGKGPFAFKGSMIQKESNRNIFRVIVGILLIIFGIGIFLT